MRHDRKYSLRAFALMLGFLGIGVAAFGQTPSINTTNGVLNSADYSASFAPGGLFSIFGTNLASATQQAPSFPLSTTMGGATVVIVGTGDSARCGMFRRRRSMPRCPMTCWLDLSRFRFARLRDPATRLPLLCPPARPRFFRWISRAKGHRW